MNETFDYVIVGGGTAGCVLASRLSADPDCSVALIEAGPEPTSPYIRIPLGLGRTLPDPRFAWHYPAETEAGDPARIWLRGKTLGGSSAVNGMVYARGHPQDYDDWEAAGAAGWGWETIRSAFLAIEDHELGATDTRGAGGPMHIGIQKNRTRLTDAILAACAGLGTPVRDDVNAPPCDGIGYSALTIRRGRRVSAYEAFLRPVRHRRNLHIVTGALVHGVGFEEGRATTVRAEIGGAARSWRARREIILCAGTIGSPRILQLSGIGAAAQLASLGIAVVADRPAVGTNLSEHKAVWLEYRLRTEDSLNRRLRGWRLAAGGERAALSRLPQRAARQQRRHQRLRAHRAGARAARRAGPDLDADREEGCRAARARGLSGGERGRLADAAAEPRLDRDHLARSARAAADPAQFPRPSRGSCHAGAAVPLFAGDVRAAGTGAVPRRRSAAGPGCSGRCGDPRRQPVGRERLSRHRHLPDGRRPGQRGRSGAARARRRRPAHRRLLGDAHPAFRRRLCAGAGAGLARGGADPVTAPGCPVGDISATDDKDVTHRPGMVLRGLRRLQLSCRPA